jgi:hypothetical protein
MGKPDAAKVMKKKSICEIEWGLPATTRFFLCVGAEVEILWSI